MHNAVSPLVDLYNDFELGRGGGAEATMSLRTSQCFCFSEISLVKQVIFSGRESWPEKEASTL